MNILSCGVISVNEFEKIGKELQRQGKTDKLKSLADSEEGKAVSRMVDADAVRNAAKSGDAAALKNILSQVLSTSEGQRLAESLKKAME